MLKDFIRRLPLSRSNAYVLLSIVIVGTQVILRALLFYLDNSQSGDTSLRVPPPNSSVLAFSGANSNASSIIASTDPSTLLYTFTSNFQFEVCADSHGPCLKFPIDQIALADGDLDFCSFVKSYATDLFRETRLEDIAFIGIHLYLFFVTIYAIARESIPHIIVLFVTRMLSLAWAIGRVIYSAMLKKSLNLLFTAASSRPSSNGQCSPPPEALKFLDPFWRNRQAFEYALLISSLILILLEAFAAWKLMTMYTQRPWRVVQVKREIRKMYKLLLGFSVVIQLAALILPVTMMLFVVVLLSKPLNIHSDHTRVYLGGVITTACLLPLWVFLGWRSLRREYKKGTIAFLLITTVLLGGWSALFDSRLFRWTFTTWWFLGTMMTASLLLTFFTLVLAIFCRLNFGKGLDHYLMVQTALSHCGFAHDNFEKDSSLDLQAEALKRSQSDASSIRSSISKFWDNIDLEAEEERKRSSSFDNPV
ncbi:hypothetical protein SCHPADRAFT_907261 [Schizopora paradoxa]|uniref:Uncharacterized protein n=1 Tax=Schizopora paradoxa TaxID=27342 RepID=A0A0H2RZ53_9AGAM|nr:hypothetical protein SCHPADRAFT_907261 [Schizopora paradoxa]